MSEAAWQAAEQLEVATLVLARSASEQSAEAWQAEALKAEEAEVRAEAWRGV